ncbi:MAG TPA: hypothetical protein VGM44_14280 [Polyangiaceae bacterium]
MPTTQSQCIPRYDAPCKVDSDCGAGFSCIADSEGCACAGSAGSADGGAPPPPPICNCPIATTSSCHALPTPCTTTADCAAGWTCEAVATPDVCAGGAPAEPPPSNSGSPTPAQDGGTPTPTPDPCPPAAPPTLMCLPPYYSLGGGSLGVSGVNGTPTAGSATGNTGSSTPTAPGSSDSATESGTSGQTSTAAGCSLGHGSKPSSTPFLLLGLGLGLTRWARRRRSAPAAR